MIFRKFVASRFCILSGISLVGLALSGCGVNSSIVPANTAINTLHGIAHGGPNPVIGATVTLYATSNSPYGATVGTSLGTATTGNDGSFSFSSPAACTAGQQAYVTVTGGNPGAGSNPNYLLVAALGPCSTISSATNIWINEVTTVAAAYALRPFVTMTTSGGLPVANIGAPAANNAASPNCTVSSGVTTGCTAAGLSHAFANALNLANSVTVSGVAPTGQAYAVTPSNSTGSVPQALINSLANSVEACVNSNGGVASDTSTACGKLFAATTPPVTSPVAPTDTFQALLNVAQYPALTPTNVTALFGVVGPTSYYQPTLLSAPTDYSLAIGYSGVNVPGTVGSIAVTAPGSGYTTAPTVILTGGGSPTTPATATASLSVLSVTITNQPTGTTCASPVVKFTGGGFLIAATATTTATSGVINPITVTNAGRGYTTAPTVSFTGSGCTSGTATASLGVSAIITTNPGAGYTSAPTVSFSSGVGNGAAATANYGVTSFGAPYVVALDAKDNVYVASQDFANANSGGSAFESGMTSNGIGNFTSIPTTVAGQTTPRSLAPDTLGFLWVASNNVAANSVAQMNATTGATVTTFSATNPPWGLAIDKSNNIWYGLIAGGATPKLFELQQSNSYANVAFSIPPAFTNQIRGIAIDANQNIYFSGYQAATNTVGVFPNTGTAAAPAYTNAVLTATLTGTVAAGIALDSSNNIWQPATTGLFEVVPTFSGATVTALTPSGPTVVSAGTPLYNSVDGAGNVWIPNNGTTQQTIVQYVPSTGAISVLSPCYAAAGATTCSTAFSQPYKTVEDSTGSVWITSASNGFVYQLLGTGYPTWPQMSLGAPGVMPQ